ncbi:MAG TPA: hypothetical protein VNB22_13835 [Pyrinomonadaceae bacterium]|nr:hypothetical protein [Pyrinomonadaceae bacterium]
MEKFHGLIQISFKYSEVVGPRSNAAGVTLSLASADNYKFKSAADWGDFDNYKKACIKAVERGVIDGLIESEIDPDSGVYIELLAVDYDDINSSLNSFYTAAKCAVMSKAIINKAKI